MRVGLKLILWLILVIASLSTANYFTIVENQELLERFMGETCVTLASNIIDKIDRDIYNRMGDFHTLSTNPVLQEVVSTSNTEFEKLVNPDDYINEKQREWVSAPHEEITPFMQELISNSLSDELRGKTEFYKKKYGYDIFPEVFVTNRYGANVGQTGKTSDYKQDDEDWWQNTKRDGVYAEDVKYDESSGAYSIAIGIRIDDINGSFLGVMKVILDIEEIINIIKESESDAEYKTTHFKLITKDGKTVYSTGGFNFLEKANEEFLSHFESGEDASYFVEGGDGLGEEVIIAYAQSSGYRDYSGLGWTLIVENKVEEIFSPVTEIRNNILIALLIAMTITTLLISAFVSYFISRPIARLKDSAKEIGEGNLDIKIDIKSSDEIGELARSFKKMAQDMKKSQQQIKAHSEDLERTVSERTSQLNDKVKELEANRTAILNMMEDVDNSNKELMEAQTKLKKSLSELKKLDQEKDTFISIAAHELKTPMTAIHGFAQLLEDEKNIKNPEARNKYLKIIEHEVDRLARLVTEVLDLSRIDLGTIKFTIESVDVAKMAEEVEVELTEKAKSKKLFLKFRKEKRLPTIQTDKERLKQVLINIVDNSIKYAEKGGTTVNIVREKDTLKFTIADTGIGIPKEHQAKMFTRFHQVENPLTRKVGGTGLGLSICKELIEALGGKIWFESHVGKGTKVFFTIPIKSRLANANIHQKPTGYQHANK